MKGTSWIVCRRQTPTRNLWVGWVIVLYIRSLVDNHHSRWAHRGHLDHIGDMVVLLAILLLLPTTIATTKEYAHDYEDNYSSTNSSPHC